MSADLKSAPRPDAAPGPISAKAPEVAVVVPVHNESENIAPLADEIVSALAGQVTYEIIYVDDGSTDATPRVLAETAARIPAFRSLRHRVCCGQSAAVATGVRSARAPVIATLDGDGQNDPADIPKLLGLLTADPDPDRLMVAGWRASRKDTAVKRLSSRIANSVRAGLLNDRTPDTGCGLKVYTRATFLNLPRFDHMHRFMPALMIRSGGRVVSVPVNHRPRHRGRSKYGTLDRLWVGLFDLVGVLWLMRRGKLPVVEPEGGERQ